MKYALIGGLVIILLGGVLLLILRPSQSAAPNDGSSTGLPVASSTQQGTGIQLGGTTTPSGSAQTLTLATTGTTTVTVQDFLHNGVTAADVENPGQYYLAGAMGYCLADGTCPGGAPTTEYHIVYNATDQAFLISLLGTPLGKARTDAELYLEATLNASQATLCQLKYYVGTDVYTSDFYAGKNLGFSFCPGATKLPTN